jgi:uridine kinase
MHNPFIIAIDGRAASGKTTLAERLGSLPVIHIDDFFLPSELRTAERLERAGENFHHERFAEEVLPFIRRNEVFSYRIFDCALGDYAGTREIMPAKIKIVEGSYSCHPVLGEYMDLRIFCDIDYSLQIERIHKRTNPEAFITKWIPLEEAYFKAFDIIRKADIIYSSDGYAVCP